MKHPSRPRPRKGFALIVVLSFVILLVILTLGLLSLSTIELRRASQTSAAAEARANAKLALMMAIGELQRELGPDQRISAPGGQLTPENSNTAGKNWVGVYEAWKSSTVNRPSAATFRRWLISGNESTVTLKDSAASGTNLATKTINLVSADPDNAALSAGVIELTEKGSATVKGGYAWWVSDNQTKAKLGNPTKIPTTTEDAMAALQASPRNSHVPFIGTSITSDDSRLDKLLSLKTVDIVSKPANSIFHDATTISNGLVTNVRNGGFRKDLNFLLEKPYSQAPKTVLYKAGNTNGMRLDELWADQNIWGELVTGSLTHADGTTLPPAPYLQPPNTQPEAFTDPFRKYRQITRIQNTVAYSLVSRRANAFSPYQIFLVTDPIVTIWNPFNVAVTIPPSVYSAVAMWHAPYQLNMEFTTPGASPAVTKWQANLYSITGVNNNALLSQSQQIVLRPGEVQVLSQTATGAPLIGINQTAVKLGMNFGSGFQYNLYRTSTDSSTGAIKDETPKLPTTINGTTQLRFFLTPVTSGAVSHGLGMTHSRQYIGQESTTGGINYSIGNFSADWTTTENPSRNGTLIPSNFPAIFRAVPYDASYSTTVSAIDVSSGGSSTRKWPLAVYTVGFRTEDDPLFSGSTPLLPSKIDTNSGLPVSPNLAYRRYTSHPIWSINPKSFTYDLGNLSNDWTNETPIQIGLRRLTNLSQIIDSSSTGLGYFGASHTVEGNSYLVTQSVPQAPLQSLGALQNSLADGLISNSEVASNSSTLERVWYLRPSISHAIANSFAPAIMGPGDTAISRDSGTKYARDLADHSYLANRALFDDYFYSSISPRTTTAHKNSGTAYSEQKSRLTSFLGSASTPSVALPNPRMKAWVDNPTAVLSEIFSGNSPASDAADRIAAYLMIDGAFNVNSTSVSAWKSFLSGLKGFPVPSRNALSPSKDPTLISQSDTPVPGLLVSAGGQINPNTLTSATAPDQWLGFRTLTDEQIEQLAKAIVKQVRLRGPFISLSDFVNRRPGTDKNLALSGPLQSALDDNTVTINEKLRQGSRSLSASEATAQGFSSPTSFPEAAAGVKSAGAPGYVKQGDLLTSLAPMITVRGDTFTIRAYGESRNKAGDVIGRAYCEAVVQRIPDYLDPADAARINPPIAKVNVTFGRRFEIISFRYLNPTEI